MRAGRRLARRLLLLAAAIAPAAAAAPAPETGPSCPGPEAEGTPAARLGETGPQLVRDANFPDPFVARFGSAYYAYGTAAQVGEARMNVQAIRSADLSHWSEPREALPRENLPAWVDPEQAQVWAPEVMRIAGRYVMFFNARHVSETRQEVNPSRVLKRHCLGAATSTRPDGPFVGAPRPLVCRAFADGVIDPSPYREGRALYLYYKEDGNCCGHKSALWVQRLRADGLAVAGQRRRLLVNNDSAWKNDDWEWEVVEAPTMVQRGGEHFLFYSGNFYGNKNYSVAYLKCAGPMGPCRDPGENPIVWSHPRSPLIGPGHQSVLQAGPRALLYLHAWNSNPDGKEVAGLHKRCLYVARIDWVKKRDGEHPQVVGGTPITTP